MNRVKNIYEVCKGLKNNLYLKISFLIFLLIMVSHSGWIFGHVPHEDSWVSYILVTKSLNSVLEYQREAWGSPIYRVLHIPLYWLLNKFFGCHWWMYNMLNVLLHFFIVIVFGKILYRKTNSIEIASAVLIFSALLPTAVYSFGMQHLYSTLPLLLMLICIYIFYARGVNFLNMGVGFILISISLYIYEATFFPAAVLGFFVILKRDRFKYVVFILVNSFCYLIPNLIFFPKFKLSIIESQRLEFLSILKFIFGPGSIWYMYSVFSEGIKGCFWNLFDIIKIIISAGLTFFIWHYAKIAMIKKEDAGKGSKILLLYSALIIFSFIVTCVLTWYQVEYLWYIPSFGVFLFITSILVLCLRKKNLRKIVFAVVLLIVILANMSLFSYQKMWKEASQVRMSIFSFFDKYESFIPEKSNILIVNIPIYPKIPDFLATESWVLWNMIDWKYSFNYNIKELAIHENPKYHTEVCDNNSFVEKFLQNDGIEINLVRNDEKWILFSDIYLVGFENSEFYPVSEVIVYNEDETKIIKSLGFLSKELAGSKPLYITRGKGIKEVIYHRENRIRYK